MSNKVMKDAACICRTGVRDNVARLHTACWAGVSCLPDLVRHSTGGRVMGNKVYEFCGKKVELVWGHPLTVDDACGKCALNIPDEKSICLLDKVDGQGEENDGCYMFDDDFRTYYYREVAMSVNCKHADHSCDFHYYSPICGYYGSKLCFHSDKKPCPHISPRDTMEEIIRVQDCMPRYEDD